MGLHNVTSIWKLDGLTWKRLLKRTWALQQQNSKNKKDKDNRKVIIQADRTVPFQVIKMVMATCGRNEYREPNFAIMVDAKGDEGASAAP